MLFRSMQSPEWKDRNRREHEALKNAPWYTRAYGFGRNEYLAKNMVQEPGVDPGVFGPPKSAMDTKQIVADANKADQEQRSAEAEAAINKILGGDKAETEKTSGNISKLENMLLKREQALEKQGVIDANLGLIMAGLGAAGGTSKNALENIAKGAQLGLGTYMTGAKQRAAGENAVLSGRLGLEKMRGLQDIRLQQMAANKEGKIAGLIGQREKQLENYAKDLVIKTGLMIDTEEGQKAIANKLAELRSGDDFLAKLYKEYEIGRAHV